VVKVLKPHEPTAMRAPHVVANATPAAMTSRMLPNVGPVISATGSAAGQTEGSGHVVALGTGAPGQAGQLGTTGHVSWHVYGGHTGQAGAEGQRLRYEITPAPNQSATRFHMNRARA